MQCWKRAAWFAADLRVWALSQRMIFLKEMAHPVPRCMGGPSSLMWMVVPPLAVPPLPVPSNLTPPAGSAEVRAHLFWQLSCVVWWLGLLLQLRLSSYTVTSARDCPCLALLLGPLLVTGYTYADKLGRDRTWASTTGLQLSWWNTLHTSGTVFMPSSHPLVQQAPKRLSAHTSAMYCMDLHLSCRCRQVIQTNAHCHGYVHCSCTVIVNGVHPSALPSHLVALQCVLGQQKNQKDQSGFPAENFLGVNNTRFVRSQLMKK